MLRALDLYNLLSIFSCKTRW